MLTSRGHGRKLEGSQGPRSPYYAGVSKKNRVSFGVLEASWEFFRVLNGFEDLDPREFKTTHVLGRRGGGAFCTPARY